MSYLILATALALFGSVNAMSQTSPGATLTPNAPTEASTERGTRLILLGTGGGPGVRANRSQPASLLVVDGHSYLIDCGDGTTQQLKRAGHYASELEGIFLTHLHFDHVGGLYALIGLNWTLQATSRPVNIYGPTGTQALLKGIESGLTIPEQLFTKILPPRLPIANILQGHDSDVTQAQVVFSDERVKVTAVENAHYSAIMADARYYGVTRSYAYKFETRDRTIVFTGDTGPSQAVTQLAWGADILVSEVIDIDPILAAMKRKYPNSTSDLQSQFIAHQKQEHLTPEEIGKMAERAKVGMVVLTHIVPGADTEASSLRYTQGVRGTYHGPVIAGRDLDEF